MTIEHWPRWADMPEFHELPSTWKLAYLTEIADVIAGQSPPSETYNLAGVGLPFLQGCAEFGQEHPSTAVSCSKPSKVAPPFSTLMSVRAPVGDLNRADQEYAIGRGLAALVTNQIDPDFLYYGLHRWRRSFQRMGQGSTFEAITARQLKQVVVALPQDEREQYRIAATLKLADNAINNSRIELNSAIDLKSSLETELLSFKYERQGGNKLTEANASSKDGKILQLKDLADIGSGVTLNQDRAPKENACRYLTVAHVQRGEIANDDDARFLELTQTERETKLLKDGDILVVEGHASSMEIGRAAMFQDNGEPTTFQNHLFRVRADASQILPKYLLYVLNSERVQRHWNAICNTSSGLNTINRRNLRNVLIQCPMLEEQRDVIGVLDAARTNIAKIEQKIVAIEEIKRSLLQNLLTGKLRIPPTIEIPS